MFIVRFVKTCFYNFSTSSIIKQWFKHVRYDFQYLYSIACIWIHGYLSQMPLLEALLFFKKYSSIFSFKNGI